MQRVMQDKRTCETVEPLVEFMLIGKEANRVGESEEADPVLSAVEAFKVET